MTTLQNQIQRDARNFARSLLAENYVFMFDYKDAHTFFGYCTLRHKHNGNRISVIYNDKGWTAYKNRKPITGCNY